MIRTLRVRSAVVAGAALLAAAAPAGAQAARQRATGGTATVTASAAAVKVLSDNGIAASPIAPATADGATFTYPIARGWFNPDNLRANLVLRGGLKLATSKHSVVLNHFRILSNGKAGYLAGVGPRGLRCKRVVVFFRRHHRLHHRRAVVCRHTKRRGAVVLARFTKPTRSEDGKSVSATVKITGYTAALINRLAGKKVAHAGDTLGTATVAPTTS